MARILVVDDDRSLVAIYREILERHEVIDASDGAGALHQITTHNPDLILLDLWLPDIDGLLLVGRIRKVSQAGLIICSARHKQADRVLGLQLGADDFIDKPFDIDDLDARVEVVLKRCRRESVSKPSASTDPEWVCGNLTYSVRRGVRVNGVPVHVTPLETRLLLELLKQPEHLVERRELWAVFGDLYFSDDTVRRHMSRLCARIAAVPGAPSIRHVKGHGYLLTIRGHL